MQNTGGDPWGEDPLPPLKKKYPMRVPGSFKAKLKQQSGGGGTLPHLPEYYTSNVAFRMAARPCVDKERTGPLRGEITRRSRKPSKELNQRFIKVIILSLAPFSSALPHHCFFLSCTNPQKNARARTHSRAQTCTLPYKPIYR